MSVLVQNYERVTHFHAYPSKMFSSLISQICWVFARCVWRGLHCEHMHICTWEASYKFPQLDSLTNTG